MIQIINAIRKPTGLERFGKIIGDALQGGVQGAAAIKGSLDDRRTRQALAERFGEEFRNIKRPDLQKTLLEGAQRQELAASKKAADLKQLQEAYPIIEQRFGKEVADLLPHLTTGAQTDYIQSLLKNEARNQTFGNQFAGNEELGEENVENNILGDESPPNIPPKKIKPIDFDQGLLPEERARREDKRYGINLPLYTDSLNKKSAAQTQQQELGVLEELSPRISVIERININPKTGEVIIPALASTDVQRYAKTINDFTRTAKESYGARVTNFDLTQFLKRLPTLANSKEGRRQIIEQLKILNQLDLEHAETLHNAFESHGGIRKLDFDKAAGMADKKMKGVIADAKVKLANIGKNINDEYKTQIEEFKKMTPRGRVAVRKADGTMGDIPKDRLAEFLEIEGNEIL